MASLPPFLREIHRRSVWQVVSVYVASAWGVVGVVDFFTDAAGLPDWTPTMAFVVMLVGLPVVVATAVIQGGLKARAQPWPVEARESDAGEGRRPGDGEAGGETRPASPTRRASLFTWRNALYAGGAAFGLLGLAVGLYFLSWSTGIGPVQNLAAQGVIDAGDPILLADFENASDDPNLGRLVTETLRVDLASSSQIALVEPAQVDNVLRLMEAEPGLPLTGARAEEVAVRGGIKAIVEGTVGDAGSGYILVARIRATATGETVATGRRTASGPDGLVDAIDLLSQDIREMAGESLRSIRAEAPLHEVTTSSLEALRLFAEARELNEEGEPARAIERVREAVEVDPEFAMAHRYLAVLLRNEGVGIDEARRAATRAFELRDRLTDRERLLAEAYYANTVRIDLLREREAYETLLERYPDDGTALNNLAVAYQEVGRLEAARDLLARAVAGPGATVTAWLNLVQLQLRTGDLDEALVTLDDALERYPNPSSNSLYTEFVTYLANGRWDAAREAVDRAAADPDLTPAARYALPFRTAMIDAARGQVERARTILRDRLVGSRDGRLEESIYPWQLASALLGLESLFGLPSVAETGSDIYRNEVLGGRVRGPDLFLAMLLFRELGLDEESRGTFEVLRAELGGTPIESFIDALSEALDAAAGGATDPDGARRAFTQVEGRLGCEDCLDWLRIEVLLAEGRPADAADMMAADTDPGEVATLRLHRLGRRLEEARAREAAGQTDRALAIYRELATALPEPDAAAQAWIDRIEARIQALQG